MLYATQVTGYSAVKYRPLKVEIQHGFSAMGIKLVEPWCPYSLKLRIVGCQEAPGLPWVPCGEARHSDIIGEALIPARRVENSLVLLGQSTRLWLHRNHQTIALVEGLGIQPCLMKDGSNRMSGDRHLYQVLRPKVLAVETREEYFEVESRFRESLDREAITV